MKNFIKARFVPLFGVIALVAVIGFSMASCKDKDQSYTVKVVNNYSKTITGVSVLGPSNDYVKETGLSIASGASQTFSFTTYSDSIQVDVGVRFADGTSTYLSGGTFLDSGTTTFTVNSSGYLTKN